MKIVNYLLKKWRDTRKTELMLQEAIRTAHQPPAIDPRYRKKLTMRERITNDLHQDLASLAGIRDGEKIPDNAAEMRQNIIDAVMPIIIHERYLARKNKV